LAPLQARTQASHRPIVAFVYPNPRGGLAAAVVCLGRSQREELLEQTAVAAERTYVFPLGIDERNFAPRSVPADEEPFVLAVGKDLARDYRTFVEAVSDLGVRFEIVACARNVAGIRLPPNVRLRTVPPDVFHDLYAGAGCVVIPQRPAGYPEGSEGGGLTALLEAMAMAKPVVASERPILADYVDDGRTALLVPPENPTALREAIERVLGDSELARSLGEAARARVERDDTTRGFAARLAPVLVAAAG
jgi:glycosyltransferase involved in cell wall biosynthesis